MGLGLVKGISCFRSGDQATAPIAAACRRLGEETTTVRRHCEPELGTECYDLIGLLYTPWQNAIGSHKSKHVKSVTPRASWAALSIG